MLTRTTAFWTNGKATWCTHLISNRMSSFLRKSTEFSKEWNVEKKYQGIIKIIVSMIMIANCINFLKLHKGKELNHWTKEWMKWRHILDRVRIHALSSVSCPSLQAVRPANFPGCIRSLAGQGFGWRRQRPFRGQTALSENWDVRKSRVF